MALGRRRNRWLFELPYLAGNVISDVLELFRSGNGVTNFGHAYLTALDGSSRLPQPPKYRSYWYDAGTHSLVGMHLGLDLIHSRGRYYFIECNLDAGLNPGRRKLYESGLDPIILKSVAVAKVHGFDRLVLVRHYWTRAQVDEFARATCETGVEVVGANLMTVDTRGHARVNPMLAMRDPLEPRTMYIVYTIANATPLLHFMHTKVFASRWLEEAMAEAGYAASRLACVPTALRLELPSSHPAMGGLIWSVKLGNADKGRGVAMGRFTTAEEARRGLRLEGGPHALPGIFRTALSRQIIDGFFRNRTRVLY